MISKGPILSLCIPTNGMMKWVIPVLDSIYINDVDESRFEVVVEDNGNNIDFKMAMEEYCCSHANLFYYKSESQGFLCQIDCFKHANGEFIKFVNHRSRLATGSLEYLISFAEENRDRKPVVFFSNGKVIRSRNKSFDEFVKKMSYQSSWSGGLAFWRDDIETISGKCAYNSFFPHIDVLFSRYVADEFIIDDRILFDDIDEGHREKGKYNLFRAFSLEYLSIIGELLRDDLISIDTYLRIKNELLTFIVELYIQFIIRKQPASYDLEHYKEYINVNYSQGQFGRRVLIRVLNKGITPIRKIVKRILTK